MPLPSSYDNAKTKRCKDELANAFTWGSTPEGYNYWADVHTKLHDMEMEYNRKYNGIAPVPASTPPSQQNPTPPMGTKVPSLYVDNHVKTVADNIPSMFDWSDSSEGSAYWQDIIKRLRHYRNLFAARGGAVQTGSAAPNNGPNPTTPNAKKTNPAYDAIKDICRGKG